MRQNVGVQGKIISHGRGGAGLGIMVADWPLVFWVSDITKTPYIILVGIALRPLYYSELLVGVETNKTF